jgi:hypothetical protein
LEYTSFDPAGFSMGWANPNVEGGQGLPNHEND